jgi:hypothetical protein
LGRVKEVEITDWLSDRHLLKREFPACFWCKVRRFSKNLGSTSKFSAPARWPEAREILPARWPEAREIPGATTGVRD